MLAALTAQLSSRPHCKICWGVSTLPGDVRCRQGLSQLLDSAVFAHRSRQPRQALLIGAGKAVQGRQSDLTTLAVERLSQRRKKTHCVPATTAS